VIIKDPNSKIKVHVYFIVVTFCVRFNLE
jgi:hypothetical protein